MFLRPDEHDALDLMFNAVAGDTGNPFDDSLSSHSLSRT